MNETELYKELTELTKDRDRRKESIPFLSSLLFHESVKIQAKALWMLGNDTGKGQKACVAIPKGCIFGAENLEADGYTFVSCVTAPHFEYAGFRLIGKDEIREKYPREYEEIAHLAY